MFGSRGEVAITQLQSQLPNKKEQHKSALILSIPTRHLNSWLNRIQWQESPEINSEYWPSKQPKQVTLALMVVTGPAASEKAETKPINTEPRKLTHPETKHVIQLGLIHFHLKSHFAKRKCHYVQKTRTHQKTQTHLHTQNTQIKFCKQQKLGRWETSPFCF